MPGKLVKTQRQCGTAALSARTVYDQQCEDIYTQKRLVYCIHLPGHWTNPGLRILLDGYLRNQHLTNKLLLTCPVIFVLTYLAFDNVTSIWRIPGMLG